MAALSGKNWNRGIALLLALVLSLNLAATAAYAEEPHEHRYEMTANVVDPTCTEHGGRYYQCSLCGELSLGDLTEPLGHAWDEGTVAHQPTEVTEGILVYTCTRCGEMKTEAIPALEVPASTDAPAEAVPTEVPETEPDEQEEDEPKEEQTPAAPPAEVPEEKPGEREALNDPSNPPVADTSADLEGAPIWERPFENLMLSGVWAEDLLRIVQTQMDYAESEDNFEAVWNDTTKQWDKNGYTRYGAWYGYPYGGWCAMFLSFCLHYAGVPQEAFPSDASAGNWARALYERGQFAAASTCVPKPGDLIFFDLDGNTYSDHCGVVCQVDAAAGMVYTVEGNRTPEVRTFAYALTDPHIAGYGILPENPDPQPHYALAASEEAAEEKNTEQASAETAAGSFVPDAPVPDGTELRVEFVEADPSVLEIVKNYVSGPMKADPSEIQAFACIVWLSTPDYTVVPTGAQVTLKTSLPLPVMDDEAEEPIYMKVSDIVAVYASEDGALSFREAKAVTENGAITEVSFYAPEPATYAVCYTLQEPTEESAEEEAKEEESADEAEESFEEIIAFDETVEVAAGSVNVTAGEGVLPEGAVLTVADAPLMLRSAKRMAAPAQVSEEESDAPENIEESTAEADAEVVIASYRYEISLQDAEGNALQPKDGGAVTLRFTLPEAANPNLYARVIHTTDEGAEILHTEREGGAVVALSDGFSLYTVEFFYEKKQYVLNGDSSAPLSEILAEIGLAGEVEAVSVSNEELFSAVRDGETGGWLVTALQPFDTQERMTVTIGGIGYEILVLDALKPVEYWDPLTGSYRTCDNYRFLTGSGVLENGWYLLNQTTSYSKAISIRGSVNIILGNDVTLTAGGGICVPSGDNAKLTVWAQTDSSRAGRLIAKPKKGCAIGGVKGVPAGEIVINGGYIEAVGADGCAAIGGADGKSCYSSITINGGEITATGGYNAAGIGGGDEATGTLGPVTINGGKVKASGTNHGAGIGGGDRRSSGSVTINGGTVEAVGGTWDDGWFTSVGSGAGIGGGLMAAQGGKVTINGGSIKAVGGYNAAGIGGGSGSSGGQYGGVGGEVLITGGKVDAKTEGRGAAIGGGGQACAGNIVITGGTVDAGFLGDSPHYLGCGIGSGYVYDNIKTNSGSVLITGGTVTASSGDAAGIGGVLTVNITGGDVAAVSVTGAGIGGSYYRDNFCKVTIEGGNVIATSLAGGAGIGSGLFGENAGASVSISGGNVWATGHSQYLNIWKETVGSAAAGNSMKWAKMYDKTQTGGNIASLAGSIADGIMMLIFNGIYSGEYAGAGIGGGAKSNGCPVTITGGQVFAAGGKSGASAIGRGLSGKKDGTLSLGNHLAVLSGNDPKKLEWKTALERISVCQQSLAAYIEPCEHELKYTDLDAVYHRAGTCKYCLDRIAAEKQTHVFDGKTHTCICGHAEVKLTLKKTYLNVDVHVRDDLNGQERYLEPDQPVYISEDAGFTVRAEAKDRNIIPIITVSHQGSGGGKTVLTPESSSQLTENGLITDIHTYRMTEINRDSGVTIDVDYENACKVSFSPGDAGVIAGVYDMPPVYVPTNRTYTVPACEYEKDSALKDKAFQGWKLTGGSVREGSGDLFKPGDTVTPLSDLAFEAQWDSGVMTYPLWVNGTHVTEQNKDDVLGDGSGSIRYVPDNETPGGTLTLNNPRPFTGGTGDSEGRVALIYAEGINLTVKGTGSVAASARGNEVGILVNGGTLTLGGSLTIDASSYGVYADNGIAFQSEAGKYTSITIRGVWNPAVTIETGTITISDDLGIVTPVSGTVSGKTIQDASDIPAKTVEIMSDLTIRFYPNSGTGDVQKCFIPAGKPYTLPNCIFTPPTGSTFRCWYIDKDEYEAGHELTLEELGKHSHQGMITAAALWKTQDYKLIGWEWQEEGDTPTAKATFAVEGSGEQETIDAEVIPEKTEDATCTEAGSIVYKATVVYRGVTYTDSRTKTVPATGHTPAEPVKQKEKAATCTENGSYDLVTLCSKCGVELKRTYEEEKALGHTWSGWTPGATADYRVCTRCNLKETKGSKTCAHLMIIEPAVEPTCTAQGHNAFYHCANCMGIYADKDGTQELSYEEVMLPAKGHTAGATVIRNKTASTCTTTGSYEEITACTVCGEFLSSEVRAGDAALGHDYLLSAWDWTKDHTAEAVFICRRDPSHQIVVSADVSVEIVASTCISEGRETYSATVNFEGKTYRDVEIRTLEKPGHIQGSPVIENETKASCTLDGFREKVIYCSYCGMELSREIEILKARGVHTWSGWQPGETGYIRSCIVCGLKETKPTEICTHSGKVIRESKAASCTGTGMKEHYRCEVCHEIFSDEAGQDPITDMSSLVIPALGHQEGSPERINIQPATCTQPGSYDEAVYCTRCGTMLSLTHRHDAVSPLGHDYGEPVWNWSDSGDSATATFTCTRDAGHKLTEQADIIVTRMEPDCEKAGWMHVFASVQVNGAIYYVEKKTVISETGHSPALPVRINVVPALCESAGSYDEAVYCEHCGKLLSLTHHENAVPPLGHLWSEWKGEGENLMRTCSRCENVQKISAALHVHQMKPDPGKEATCTETGIRSGYVCTICGEHFADEEGTKEAQILPLKEHTPGEVEIEFDPEDLNGYYECVYCTVCGTMLSLDWVEVPAAQGYYYSDATRVWVKGSNKPAEFTVKRSVLDDETYNLFRYISVDGATVDRRFYTRARGSLVLDLLSEYLETLSLGRHTLTAVFNDGQASTDFVVIARGSGSGSYSGSGTIDYIYNPQARTVSNNPRTGDESHLALWGMLAAVSATGALFLAKKRKHREN